MKIHLRFESNNGHHAKATIFVNSKNTGQLTMSPDELDWFYQVLEKGCKVLSAPGLEPIEFVGSIQK